MDNYKFFENKNCEYYPCHKTDGAFNCLFCYCPLYPYDCGGNFKILKNGIKDCSECIIPHKKDNWEYITKKLAELG